MPDERMFESFEDFSKKKHLSEANLSIAEENEAIEFVREKVGFRKKFDLVSPELAAIMMRAVNSFEMEAQSRTSEFEWKAKVVNSEFEIDDANVYIITMDVGLFNPAYGEEANPGLKTSISGTMEEKFSGEGIQVINMDRHLRFAFTGNMKASASQNDVKKILP